MIYIDPPYNTDKSSKEGNQFYSEKDDIKASKFIYRDKFSRNGWLNMMNERLKMARSLLKDDGVIFVSIDDNEQAYLKVLMDEIFGEENFVANLVWRKKNTGGGSDKSKIEIETEFVICYSKNNQTIWNSHQINKEDYTLEDEYISERGKYYLTDLDRVSSSSSFKYSNSLDYEIQAPDGTMFKNYRNIINPMSYSYTLGKDLFDFSFNNGFIEIQRKIAKDGTEYWKAYKKVYEKVTINREKPYQIIPRVKGKNFSNLIRNRKITTSNGKRNLISIIQNKDFAFPKPVRLIKYIINLISNKNARILDFFAGSGTTAHAVLELNHEDGGNRSFTIVTNDENGISTNICYERIYRINNGIGTKGESFKWAQKNQPFKANLNVFKTQYFYTSITSKQNDLIKKTYLQMLKDFNITDISENNMNEQNILVSLTALKPVKKGE
ncbi:site-specific DNA-methyltransferase [Mycoplasma tauri]|uniref:site-specific DNA-methyltransferase n=1 Tax=Mycoplasma tauri TaxID=547987 RepID=UPI002804D3D1|nr:site-specific DNA-methyltransferase [Mycoplasma tauri]